MFGTMQFIPLEIAQKIMAAAEAEARDHGWNVAVAIVDAGMNLLMFQKMDGVQTASIDVAIGKARTAAGFKRPTKALEEMIAGGRTAFVAVDGVVPVQGGLPIKAGEEVLGAIGVSGLTLAQDEQVAAAGLKTTEPDVPRERTILDKLDGWVNDLVAPALPLHETLEGDNQVRLQFRQEIPESVMVGKLVRAVSGLRGALSLAETGHVTECGAVLRIVSDFCTEIRAIGFSLKPAGKPPDAVEEFVNQYFMPRARTQNEFAERRRMRYVSREQLMKAQAASAAMESIDKDLLISTHRFINMVYDSYVHGAYETTMELWNPETGSFEMRGHPSTAKRVQFVEAVFLKMHEVVVATEIVAAKTSHRKVFEQARETRRSMDASAPWKSGGGRGPD